MAVLSHVQAAVDSPDLPCDVGGLVAGEEADRPGDFFRPAEPTNRDLSTEPLLVDHLAHDTPAIISVADIPWCTVIRRPGYLAVMSAMNFSAGSW